MSRKLDDVSHLMKCVAQAGELTSTTFCARVVGVVEEANLAVVKIDGTFELSESARHCLDEELGVPG